MATCNICGGTDFAPAPGGRLGRNGTPPLCTKCRSTERNRVARLVADKIRVRDKFAGYSLLIWGEQGAVAKGWFASAELVGASEDAGLKARADGTVDMIVAAHVLQRAEDHRATLAELVRVLSDEGMLLLSYPNPLTRSRTVEFPEGDPQRKNGRRVIGTDFEDAYAQVVPEAIVFVITAADPVTGDPDMLYIATKNPEWMRRMFKLDLDCRILD